MAARDPSPRRDSVSRTPAAGPGSRDDLGRRGEAEAERFLRRLGYRIVGRRERVLRGDIDLVALDGRTVVFVEVRSRSSTAHGHPAETVGFQKQRRIAELANAYIRRHRLEDCAVRIDVVAVTFNTGSSPPVVEHYQNAFDSP
jgi:putative endonuclease